MKFLPCAALCVIPAYWLRLTTVAAASMIIKPTVANKRVEETPPDSPHKSSSQPILLEVSQELVDKL